MQPKTVFKVYYRLSSDSNYKEFKSNTEITDVAAATAIRNHVAKTKGTKDVYVSTSKVRAKLDGTTVSDPYNYLVKK